MILDHISNACRYLDLHPEFQRAFSFLEAADFAALPDGRHDIKGDKCFVVVARGPGRGRRDAKLEAHRQYIDIQFAIEGTDEIGWKPTPHCSQIELPFDGSTHFEDSETTELMPVEVADLRRHHHVAVSEFREKWERLAEAWGVRYFGIHTGMSYVDVLMQLAM